MGMGVHALYICVLLFDFNVVSNNFYMFCSQCFSFTVVMVIVFNYVLLGKFLLIASRFDMTCVILALFVHL